jgi:hypothetical protein
MASPSRMGQLLESGVDPGIVPVVGRRAEAEFGEIESRLRTLFGRNVPVRDIELLVPEVRRRLGVGRPQGRKRGDYLNWMKQNSPRIMDVIQDLLTDRPPAVD